LNINQDAKFNLGKFDEERTLKYKLNKNRGLYIFVISGSISVETTILEERDAVQLSEAEEVEIRILTRSEFLLIEVPMDVVYET
jgi:hypothetical protein